jgi:hypothetical protein
MEKRIMNSAKLLNHRSASDDASEIKTSSVSLPLSRPPIHTLMVTAVAWPGYLA